MALSASPSRSGRQPALTDFQFKGEHVTRSSPTSNILRGLSQACYLATGALTTSSKIGWVVRWKRFRTSPKSEPASMLAYSRRDFLTRTGGLAAAIPAMGMRPPGDRPRQLLSSAWTPDRLLRVLVPADDWKPFPPASSREEWQALPRSAREALVAAGVQHQRSQWAPIPATLFLEFVRSGKRSHFEQVQFGRRVRLGELVLAECVEGQGRFFEDIANGIWATCEETFWGVPAHLGMQKRGTGLPDVTEPVIDLFAAETASLIAWSTYLLGTQLDTVHPLIRERGALEIERRVLAPYRERDDFWWMGLSGAQNDRVNNWNPWIKLKLPGLCVADGAQCGTARAHGAQSAAQPGPFS